MKSVQWYDYVLVVDSHGHAVSHYEDGGVADVVVAVVLQLLSAQESSCAYVVVDCADWLISVI